MKLRCRECHHAIQANDDAEVCCQCGGLNLRSYYAPTDPLPPSLDDTVRGLLVIAGIAILLALVFFLVEAWWKPAHAQAPVVVADPPMLIRIDGPAVAYTLDGQRIALPAGTEIDACPDADGLTTGYNIAPRMTRILRPCIERPLFRDGFEG